jgi:ectoine hydroxylase-related dioxygenase (phytanoyl-CoA dioxygenase family)
MSEAKLTPEEAPPRIFETRQPFDLSDELQARVEALGLVEAVEHVKENGYGYIHNAVTMEFVDRLRETIIRISESDGMLGGQGANMLLAKDPVFEEAVLNPKVLAIAEVLCGHGALLSQVAGSIKKQDTSGSNGKGGLHADQNWTPAPFPVHNQLATFCWAMDDYNAETGSTTVVPKTHLLRRHPNEQEVAEEPGAVATECPAGSIVFWDGATWHSGGAPRKVDGVRVVLHVTYGRLALRPVESYDFLDEDWLKDRPYEMRVLLGREDFLATPQGGFAHGEKLSRTMDWSKN